MYQMAWRNLTMRRSHTLLTVATVMVATAVLFSSALSLWGLRQGTEVGMKRFGADLLVLPADAEGSVGQVLFTGVPVNTYLSAEEVERVQGIRGVHRVTAQFFTQTLGEGCCTVAEETRIVGFDPGSDFVVLPWIEGGHRLALEEDELLVGAGLPGFPGHQINLLGRVFRVAGNLQATGTGLDHSLFVSIKTARELARGSPDLQGLWTEDRDPGGLVSSILVQVEPDADPQQVARDIAAHRGVKVVSAARVLAGLRGQLSTWIPVLTGLGAMIWVMAVLGVAGRFAGTVLERKQEIGVMRAIGARREDVFHLILGEAVATGLGGGLAGIGAGWLIFAGVRSGLRQWGTMPFLSPPLPGVVAIAAGCLALAVVAAAVAGWFPARACAALDPAVAIAAGELE